MDARRPVRDASRTPPRSPRPGPSARARAEGTRRGRAPTASPPRPPRSPRASCRRGSTAGTARRCPPGSASASARRRPRRPSAWRRASPRASPRTCRGRSAGGESCGAVRGCEAPRPRRVPLPLLEVDRLHGGHELLARDHAVVVQIERLERLADRPLGVGDLGLQLFDHRRDPRVEQARRQPALQYRRLLRLLEQFALVGL